MGSDAARRGGKLTPGAAVPFLRSGMSALLGLLALPRSGLAGATPRLPEELDLRGCAPDDASSFRSPPAVVVWLRLGPPTEGMAGPAGTRERETFQTPSLKATIQFNCMYLVPKQYDRLKALYRTQGLNQSIMARKEGKKNSL